MDRNNQDVFDTPFFSWIYPTTYEVDFSGEYVVESTSEPRYTAVRFEGKKLYNEPINMLFVVKITTDEKLIDSQIPDMFMYAIQFWYATHNTVLGYSSIREQWYFKTRTERDDTMNNIKLLFNQV